MAALSNAAQVPPTVIGLHDNVSLSVNWYLNSWTRLMGNYAYSETSYTFIGASDANNFGLRAQVDF